MVAIIGQTKLEKDRRRCILQGVAHTAPQSFWDKVQHELDDAVNKGYMIFCEGISVEEGGVPNSREQQLRQLVIANLNEHPCGDNLVLQSKGVRYPNGMIYADVTLANITERLAKADLPEEIHPDTFRKLFGRTGFDAAPIVDEIFVDYRNRVIFDKVRNSSDGENVFLIYGEAHLPGLAKLFVEDGWTNLGWNFFQVVV
jgi:hypothetical protein